MYSRLRSCGAVLLALLPLLPVHAQLADPTRPPHYRRIPAQGASAGPRWEVRSILIAGERRVAVVNGKTVRKGDIIGDAKILEVLPHGVRIKQRGRVFTVRLLPARIKRSIPRNTETRE